MTADAAVFLKILALILALWSGLCVLLSFMSGWHRLADQFRATGKSNSVNVWFCQARMRYGVHYGNIVNLGFAEDGMRISVVPLFRIGHAPLHIPWTEIQVLPPVRFLYFFAFTQLILGRATKVPLTIYSRKAQRLLSLTHSAATAK